MMNTDVLAELVNLGSLSCDEPMARHTTFGIGGPADVYLKVATRAGLVEAIRAATRHGLPHFVLGSGSNILVGDAGFRGVVIENDTHSVEGPQTLADGSIRLRADSGVSFASLARRMCREGYWGLEWAIGIPGALGGAVVYNAGAYGGCLADVLSSIDLVTAEGCVETVPASALSLEYRGSLFTRGFFRNRLILSLELNLRSGDPIEIEERINALDAKRKAAQPPGRNAGSVFKNPESKPAWWYIDQVGLRGARTGGAQISPKHANFFMNVGRARAEDVKTLMDEATRRVHDRFGVDLHPEIALIGEGFGPAGVTLCADKP